MMSNAENLEKLYFTKRIKQTLGNYESALLLERIRYWFIQVGREFYKFNTACEHPAYKSGDSWQEELAMNYKEFIRARKTIATRIKSGMSKSELMKTHNEDGTLAPINRIVLYWQDKFNRLWYWFNQELYDAHFLSESSSQETSQDEKQAESAILYRLSHLGDPIALSQSGDSIELTQSGDPMNQEIQQEIQSKNTDDDEIKNNSFRDQVLFLREQGVHGKVLDELKTKPLTELVEAFEIAKKKSGSNPVGYAITILQQGIFENSLPKFANGKSENQFADIDLDDFVNKDVPSDTPAERKKYPWEKSDSLAKKSESSPPDKSLSQIVSDNFTAQRAWNATYIQLEYHLGRVSFIELLRDAKLLRVEKDGTLFVVKVHNSHAQDTLQHRLYRNVRRVLRDATGKSNIEIKFISNQIPTPAHSLSWQNQVTNNYART